MAHRLLHHSGAAFPCGHQGPADLKRPWQARSLQALGRGQITVAGAAGHTIGFAPGGAAADLQRQREISHHPAQHHQLLPVLFAEPELLRADQAQQAAHHRGHPFEMARTMPGAEAAQQRRRRAYAGEARVTGRKELCGRGHEQGRGSGGLRQGAIGIERAGVRLEVLPWAELERVDEQAHQHAWSPPAAIRRHHRPASPLNQAEMAGMERPHGGHEMQGHVPGGGAAAPTLQLPTCSQQAHRLHKRKAPTERFSDGTWGPFGRGLRRKSYRRRSSTAELPGGQGQDRWPQDPGAGPLHGRGR